MSDMAKTLNDVVAGFAQVVQACMKAQPEKKGDRMVTIKTTVVTFDMHEAQEMIGKIFSAASKSLTKNLGRGLGEAFAQHASSSAGPAGVGEAASEDDGHHCHDCDAPMSFAERIAAIDETILASMIHDRIAAIEVRVPGQGEEATILDPKGLHALATSIVYEAMTPQDVILMLDSASENYAALSDLVTEHVEERHRIQVLKAIIEVCKERRGKIDTTKAE